MRAQNMGGEGQGLAVTCLQSVARVHDVRRVVEHRGHASNRDGEEVVRTGANAIVDGLDGLAPADSREAARPTFRVSARCQRAKYR